MGLLRNPLRNFHCPGLAVLEAPQPPYELWSPCGLYPYGSLHTWHSHRFLRQCNCPSGITHYNGRIPRLDALHATEQGKFVGFHFCGSSMTLVCSMTFLEWHLGYLVALSHCVSLSFLFVESGSKSVAVMTGIVGIFIPFSSTFSLVYAIGGTLLFSGYIVYDTYLINRRLSPDEYIMGAISLYLDFVNLFLSILRLLSSLQDR